MLFVTRRPTAAEQADRMTNAKYEPAAGCYLGAFIDFDSTLKHPTLDGNRTTHQDPDEFERIVGKPHSMYFFYLGYGRQLPTDWVRSLAARNKFVHIALEPNDGLRPVKDDAYLRGLADDMSKSGARIFLRFASEMNGVWTAYHRDPAEYRRKFRLVYRVMHERAPNVAVVWCPYTFPRTCLPAYYPGDDATDWVGVNMYSVTYHDNNRAEPCGYEHPADLLNQVYRLYSARKPIMVCEFGATHNASIEKCSRTDFAMNKILTLYSALPRIFPRVKCINYFDANTLQFAADHAYNDYSVTDDPTVTGAYRFAVSSPYFLSGPPAPGEPVPPMTMPIRKDEPLAGRVRLSCWARARTDAMTVRYLVDGYVIYHAHRPDLWECIWDAGSVRPGRHMLCVEVLRRNNRVVARRSTRVITDAETPDAGVPPPATRGRHAAAGIPAGPEG